MHSGNYFLPVGYFEQYLKHVTDSSSRKLIIDSNVKLRNKLEIRGNTVWRTMSDDSVLVLYFSIVAIFNQTNQMCINGLYLFARHIISNCLFFFESDF